MSLDTQNTEEVPRWFNPVITAAASLVVLLIITLVVLAAGGSERAGQTLLALCVLPFVVIWARKGGVFGKQ